MRNRLSESPFTPLNPSFPVLLSPKSASYDLPEPRYSVFTKWPIKYQLSMSPHIIGSGIFLVTQGTYGDIMVKELVCRLRVLGSVIYVHDLTGLKG